jgi:cytochrome b6-f complex subunit 5
MRNKQKNLSIGRTHMVEPLLSGIVLGLIPVTLAGLFVAAYMQYKRGDQLGINK